ncbi:nuclease-related domain-containing protein [Cytobacillus sp. Hz8]|uniref:nuclease-related domain-containing protein n=1 Tax=Cytobacillus sp. Hz8 TaxID=3347168 RepID=UPI0035DA0B0F
MIQKEREFPLAIQLLEILLSRLAPNHPKKPDIEKELAKRWLGYRGEQNLDYHLHFIPEKQYTILHNLRLTNNEKYYFQMDTLLLHQNFLLIIEAKNIMGKLLFEGNHNQLIRNMKDHDEAFQDPITQVKNQQFQLASWLQSKKLPSIPIDHLIVISNDSSIIQTQSISTYNKHRIIHAPLLKERIESIRSQYKQEVLNQKVLKKITKLLISEHTPLTMDFLQKFNLSNSTIRNGVRCPNCNSIPMERAHSTWLCHSCGTTNKNAHIEAIYEYFSLIKPFITNQEARKFLLLSSKDTASRLLKGMNLPSTGSYRDKKYFPLGK